MAGQVGKLTLKAVIDGFEDVQGLGKALQVIQERSKKADKSFIDIAKSIKEFGKETFKTNAGLKGQIQAFEKLRDRTNFQGKAYQSLTSDIKGMNNVLRERIALEKEITTRRGTPRGPGRDATFGAMSSSYFTDKNVRGSGTQSDFNQRIASLQLLLTNRTFESLSEAQQKFLNNISYTKAGNIDRRSFPAGNRMDFIGDRASVGAGRGSIYNIEDFKNTGRLNQTQLDALGLTQGLDVASNSYLKVLTKINAEEGQNTKILSQQNLRAAEQIALAKAQTRASEISMRFQESRARSKVFQDARADTLGPSIGATYFGGQAFPGPSTRAFRDKSPLAQQFQNVMAMVGLPSPTYKGMEAEYLKSRTGYSTTTRGDKFGLKFPSFNEFFAGGGQESRVQETINKFGRIQRQDKFGLGKDLSYPKTEAGYAAEIQDLGADLKNLKIGGKEWVETSKLIIKKDKELSKILSEANEKLKTRVTTMKALPAAGQTSVGKAGALAVYDAGFASKQSSGIKQTVESLDQYLARVTTATKVQNKNINSLTKQRSKLDEIRNGLDPTSASFKKATKAIAATDKALLRLSNNKFSGQNLRRTGQSILGAGFVGGPAGFLGAGVGAGIEALRPGGDMAGGAITGGLVASQVLTPVSQAIGGATTYASDIEKANIALRGVTKSTENYEIAQAAITKAVEEYNVPQEVATRGMTRLSAAVLGAGGNIHNATEAFLNTTVAIKGTAGSADDVKSAITAMVQIFSKGKVSAEELSGQLGERFPAAVTKFAKANNISTQQLQKNLKDGTVGLDMLSKFITSLGDEYEPLARKIAASNEEAGARSQIAMNKMKIAVGNALKPVGAEFQIIGAQLLTDLIPTFELLAAVAASVVKPLASLLSVLANNFDLLSNAIFITTAAFTGLAISKIIVAFKGLSVALGLATIAQGKFNIAVQINPYVAAATALAGLTLVVMNFGKKYRQTADEIKKGLLGQSLDVTRKELKKLEVDLASWQAKLTDQDELAWYGRRGIQKEIDLINKQIKARREFIKADEAMGMKKATFPTLEKEFGQDSPFVKFAEDLDKFEESLQNVAVNGFKKLEDSIMQFVTTGKLAIKDLVTSVIHDLTRLMIRQTITKPLFSAFTSALTGGNPVNLITDPFGTDSKFGGVTTEWNTGMAIPSAKGNTFARNGIVPYYKGGVIRNPTMSLMGEKGPEAVLPLQRGRGGRLGVVMQGGGGGTTNVNYTGPTLNFNGDEYVPRSAVGGIINAAAKQGASMGQTSTMRSLQNNRSARSRIGM